MGLFKRGKVEEPRTQACPRCASQVRSNQDLCPRCAWDLGEAYQGPRVAEVPQARDEPAA
jgi:hypothetical protein